MTHPLLQRPLVHHTPPDHWMNDPVGLFHANGVWTLHYQRAVDPERRAMGWGRATSRDLLRWEAGGTSLAPGSDRWIYSGSAVVTDGGVQAFYTLHEPSTGHQRQERARSTDGVHWTPDPANPLIDERRGETRDPFVFRYGEGWRMIVAEPVAWSRPTEGRSRIAVYASGDLAQWQRRGDLGIVGPPCVMFETPMLAPLPVEGLARAEWPWLLLAGVIDRSDDGAVCGTQGWIGTFDGQDFIPAGDPFLLDRGPDFYAAAPWAGTPDDTLIVTAWANSWAYARHLAGDGWIGGAHALPRRLSGVAGACGKVRLVQRPAALPQGQAAPAVDGPLPRCAILRVASGTGRIAIGDALTLDLAADRITLIRAEAAGVPTSTGFGGTWSAPRPAGALTILLDGCVVELFADDGSLAMTALLLRADEATLRLAPAIAATMEIIAC